MVKWFYTPRLIRVAATCGRFFAGVGTRRVLRAPAGRSDPSGTFLRISFLGLSAAASWWTLWTLASTLFLLFPCHRIKTSIIITNKQILRLVRTFYQVFCCWCCEARDGLLVRVVLIVSFLFGAFVGFLCLAYRFCYVSWNESLWKPKHFPGRLPLSFF